MTGSSGDDPRNTRGLLARAREYHHRESLTPEEYTALKEIGTDLTNPGVYDHQSFILGSYDSEKKFRLNELKQAINLRAGADTRAYLMEDFADGLHPLVKFRVIADYSDSVIGICEHDQGGFQLELGLLVALSEYQDRAHLLKRTYPQEVEHRKYNWMLEKGVFDLFDYRGRLREWESSVEFDQEMDDLLSDIID